MAGRKDKNVVDYFPHFCNQGKSIFILESKFGHIGYSVWFKTLEILGNSENHFIDLRNETDLLFLVSKLKITENQLMDIYDLLAKIDSIDRYFWSKKIVFSENFLKNVEEAYKRRNNKCMQKCDLCKHLFNKCDETNNYCKHKFAKESKVEESKENESKYPLFFIDWLDYKKSRKETYKNDKSIEACYNHLMNLSYNNISIAEKIILQSMANNWAGLFELKETKKETTQQKPGNFTTEHDKTDYSDVGFTKR